MIRINDLNSEELKIFTDYTENELAHIYEPKEGLFIAESMKVLERAIAGGYTPKTALVEDKVASEVEKLLEPFKDVVVYCASFEVLTSLTGYHMTGGVLCAMERKKLSCYEEVFSSDLGNKKKLVALLENVVNPTNIGAIFRNAAALGVEEILLSPGCCDPLYRRAIRVSMGTVFQIPWTFIAKEDWPLKAMQKLKENGYATVSMALDDRAIAIDDEKLRAEKKLVVLLGSEGNGLCDETIELCDYTVMIPMSHEVDSLNVAAASALAFWELGK